MQFVNDSSYLAISVNDSELHHILSSNQYQVFWKILAMRFSITNMILSILYLNLVFWEWFGSTFIQYLFNNYIDFVRDTALFYYWDRNDHFYQIGPLNMTSQKTDDILRILYANFFFYIIWFWIIVLFVMELICDFRRQSFWKLFSLKFCINVRIQ